MTTHWHRIKADGLRRELGDGYDLWSGHLAKVLVEGRGPGPRNVLAELGDGRRVVLIRRDKSLFKHAEPLSMELFK